MFDRVGQQRDGPDQRQVGHRHQLAGDLVGPLLKADQSLGEVDPPRIIGLDDR
jgi:hypothetical protein